MGTFNGSEGSVMTETAAAALTATFRKNYASQPKAYFYGYKNINTILNQTGAMGIRIYFGEDSSGNLQLILVAADANQNDMLSSSIIYDTGAPCPAQCGSSDPLNS
jgi:hypothetical protein